MKKKTLIFSLFLMAGCTLLSQTCPKVVGSVFDDPEDYNWILFHAIEEDLLYMILHNEITIYDISSPDQPILLNEFESNTCSTVFDFVVKNRRVHINDTCGCPGMCFVCNGYSTWDLTDPENPEHEYHHNMLRGTGTPHAINDLVIFTSGEPCSSTEYLEIYRFDDSGMPVEVSITELSAGAYTLKDIFIRDRLYALVGTNTGGFFVYDLHDLENPELIRFVDIPGTEDYIGSIQYHNGYLYRYYRAENEGIIVYELLEDFSINEVSRWQGTLCPRTVQIVENLMIIGDFFYSLDGHAISILDISHPEKIREIAYWDSVESNHFLLYAMSASHDNLVLSGKPDDNSGNYGFLILDISQCHPRSLDRPESPLGPYSSSRPAK